MKTEIEYVWYVSTTRKGKKKLENCFKLRKRLE